jgi:hypothetical protein
MACASGRAGRYTYDGEAPVIGKSLGFLETYAKTYAGCFE